MVKLSPGQDVGASAVMYVNAGLPAASRTPPAAPMAKHLRKSRCVLLASSTVQVLLLTLHPELPFFSARILLHLRPDFLSLAS